MRYFKYLLLTILATATLVANEYCYNLDKYLIDTISKSDSYCKRLKRSIDSNICFKKSIKYVKFQKENGLRGINKGHISIIKKENYQCFLELLY